MMIIGEEKVMRWSRGKNSISCTCIAYIRLYIAVTFPHFPENIIANLKPYPHAHFTQQSRQNETFYLTLLILGLTAFAGIANACTANGGQFTYILMLLDHLQLS